MKLLAASTLTAALLTGSAGAVALVAGVPDEVGLPDQAQVPEEPEKVEVPEAEENEAEEAETDPGTEEGEPASEVGRERRAAAMTFVELSKAWTSCVEEAAAAHDESTGPFSPREACGDRPAPPVPDQAADKVPSAGTGSPGPELPEQGGAGREMAEEKAAEGRSRGEAGPGNAPADRQGGRP